jgi:hypothetical protein
MVRRACGVRGRWSRRCAEAVRRAQGYGPVAALKGTAQAAVNRAAVREALGAASLLSILG